MLPFQMLCNTLNTLSLCSLSTCMSLVLHIRWSNNSKYRVENIHIYDIFAQKIIFFLFLQNLTNRLHFNFKKGWPHDDVIWASEIVVVFRVLIEIKCSHWILKFYHHKNIYLFVKIFNDKIHCLELRIRKNVSLIPNVD